jgi:hypothetical protein
VRVEAGDTVGVVLSESVPVALGVADTQAVTEGEPLTPPLRESVTVVDGVEERHRVGVVVAHVDGDDVCLADTDTLPVPVAERHKVGVAD